MELYARWRKWRKGGVKEEDGIVVASDVALEWLLPWWWESYARHNSFPVAFVDFGMSLSMREWCKKRGEAISLPVADTFVSQREEIDPAARDRWEIVYGKAFWASRGAYFKKPLACLQSPFRRSVWIDLDCEVRGPLNDLFSFCDRPPYLSLALDQNGEVFNSGVIVFQRGGEIVKDWAKSAFDKSHLFASDQDLLWDLIQEKKLSLEELPLVYNWSRCKGENPQAIVLHWHGAVGKKIIYQKIHGSAPGFLQPQ